MHKPSDFHFQTDYYECFNLVTAIAKPVLQYTRYRDIFFTINIVDEILSIAHPYRILLYLGDRVNGCVTVQNRICKNLQ